MWVAETEGAKFWLGVVTQLRNRGVEDIFVACVDGLKGLAESIDTVYPKTEMKPFSDSAKLVTVQPNICTMITISS